VRLRDKATKPAVIAALARYPEFEVPLPEARPPYGHLGHNFPYNAVFDREARPEPPHL